MMDMSIDVKRPTLPRVVDILKFSYEKNEKRGIFHYWFYRDISEVAEALDFQDNQLQHQL